MARTLLDSNPACEPSYLGSISGDAGQDQLQAVGAGEGWYRATLAEDNDGEVYLSATVQLECAAGSNYDP